MEKRMDEGSCMIPYFQLTTFSIGPVTIQVWGLLVAIGIFAATFAATRLARERGMDEKIYRDLVVWVIIGAFVGARLVHIIYEPSLYFENPIEFIKIWHGGFSVMGGFLGAFSVGIWYLRHKKLEVLKYVDTGLFALPLGLFIGRIGCFFIHDHPGTLSHFFLAVQYPGGARHDHGLYLSLNGLVMFLVFLWMRKKQAGIGAYTVVFFIWYGIVRFVLDFFRATEGAIVDTRYLGLTPAQFCSIAMVLIGFCVWIKLRQGARQEHH